MRINDHGNKEDVHLISLIEVELFVTTCFMQLIPKGDD